jgi:hypothetical protein
MNRPRCLVLAAVFAVFWCTGVFFLLPRMETKLRDSASRALSAQHSLAGRLDRLQVSVEGQTARLTGLVRTVQDRQIAEVTLRDFVRAPATLAPGFSSGLNPVASVRNELEIAPFPAGWMLLAIEGARARLLGAAATDYESRDLLHSIADRWSAAGGRVEGALSADLQHHDEAADVSATLRSIPAPDSSAKADTPRVELHLAQIGRGWERLPLDETPAHLLTRARAAGIREAEWSQVAPLLATLRQQHAQAVKRDTLRRQEEKKPPAHLFIAVRGDQVRLAGAVSSAEARRALLDEALAAFSPRRVHDGLRVDAQCRADAQFPPFTAALLPGAAEKEAKAFHLAIDGGSWQPLDWRGAREEPSWKADALPPALSATTLRADNAQLIDWLQGGPDPAGGGSRTQPAFLLLALAGEQAILAGQIAEPALHAQILHAARTAYTAPGRLDAEAFTIRATCESSAAVLQTPQNMPARSAQPVLALAQPGGAWKTIPLTASLLQPGALGRSGFIPDTLPAALVESTALEALETLPAALLPP